MSSSSCPVTPARQSSSSSSVPTDLTVTSSDSSAGLAATNRRLSLELRLARLELGRREAAVEAVRAECEQRVERAERGREEDIQARCELRLATHAREMNKIQTAINTQLEQVIGRQKYLETVNTNLRQTADTAKQQLLSFSFDPSRLAQLSCLVPADMSLLQCAELIIYRNIQQEKQKLNDAQKTNAEVQEKFSKLSQYVAKSEKNVEKYKDDNLALNRQLRQREQELCSAQQATARLQQHNTALLAGQRAVPVMCAEETGSEVPGRGGAPGRREGVAQQLAEIQQSCAALAESGRAAEAGLDRLSSLTSALHNRQLQLLDQFSSSVSSNRIDEKYRTEYLATIQQLVGEQVRTQTFLTSLLAERDCLARENSQAATRLANLQMDLVEEEIKRGKEEEKVEFLQEQLSKQRDGNKEHWESVSIENTKEYEQIWNDLQTLLQHKEEIVDMKEFIQKLQEKSKFI